jgi:alginate O-acetyltransferase complex protein AlgI
MVFCSPVFLFLFLPLVLAVHAVLPRRLRNAWLLLASLLFYAWGEKTYTLVMLGSILFNYLLVLAAEPLRRRGRQALAVAFAVAVNLGVLVAFKYANFLVDNLNVARGGLGLPAWKLDPVHLPIGVSFFTFHALSYVVDVCRGRTPAQKNPIDFGLYITLFPQLVAGPIVRYSDLAGQLARRSVVLAAFARGARRFVFGLAKKMLLANTLGAVADKVFALHAGELTAATAWLGAVCYLLQIYFDFSGYSDMAIGLAALFGFTFKENFDYPYVARSVTEFWRRWHMSLSTWFRDYLYIPLGGNRVGPLRRGLNLLTVFVLCGLWHGAGWTFLLWGLYHGLFLVLERAGLGRALDRTWSPLRRLYTLLVVLVGWVFFRSATLAQAGAMLTAMAGLGAATGLAPPPGELLARDAALALAAGVLFSCPVLAWLQRGQLRLLFAVRGGRVGPSLMRGALALADLGAFALLFVASAAVLAATTYNPFIYFRF